MMDTIAAIVFLIIMAIILMAAIEVFKFFAWPIIIVMGVGIAYGINKY